MTSIKLLFCNATNIIHSRNTKCRQPLNAHKITIFFRKSFAEFLQHFCGRKKTKLASVLWSDRIILLNTIFSHMAKDFVRWRKYAATLKIRPVGSGLLHGNSLFCSAISLFNFKNLTMISARKWQTWAESRERMSAVLSILPP